MYILMPYCLTVVIPAYLGYYYPHITCHYDYPIRCSYTDTPPDRMVLSRPRPPPPPPTHLIQAVLLALRPFKCSIRQWGWGCVTFPGKKRYKAVRFNVISVTNWWVCVNFPEKKRCVTLEWPLYSCSLPLNFTLQDAVYQGSLRSQHVSKPSGLPDNDH